MALGAFVVAGIILAAFTGTYLALVTVFWVREYRAPASAPRVQSLPDPDTPGWSIAHDGSGYVEPPTVSLVPSQTVHDDLAPGHPWVLVIT